jgi:purine-nucleoside phosphorylase
MQGRFHYYEGYDIHEVVYPIRVLHQLGSEFLLVTNAAGGINTGFKAGNLMLIEDHLNMMGMNPLLGRNLDMLGPRFPDMSQAYNKQLIEVAEAIGKSLSIDLVRGIYAAMSGPTYETPAEVRMLQCLGADAVGMSTVPEVIVANHMSMKVLGISCISNLAAGLSPVPLSHAEVMETAEQVKPKFIQLLSGILDHLAEQLSSAS